MYAIVDIGKTHLKLVIIDHEGRAKDSFSATNAPCMNGPYPHADVDGIWRWLESSLQSSCYTREIAALIFTTHGATAALVDVSAERDGLVLPVLDYEFAGVQELDEAYGKLRPDYRECYSPSLPAGLNLGRQLHWQQTRFPAQFNAATHILLYPQYWAWRCCGQVSCEVTSLGCHTDLWQPATDQYSSLVEQQGWKDKFAPILPVDTAIGCVSEQVSSLTGLSVDCQVFVGLHDSNASFVRYLKKSELKGQEFTVISSGTWTILMHSGGALSTLNQATDMLANVDVNARPVCCARFMGGREYESICRHFGAEVSAEVTKEAVQQAIDQRWMVTPDFSDGNGPFGGREPKLLCPTNPDSPQALATLYCALLIDQRLTELSAKGPIFIEGAILRNPVLCALVSQLRSDQPVWLSEDSTGTVMGAAALMCQELPQSLLVKQCESLWLTDLPSYRDDWYRAFLD